MDEGARMSKVKDCKVILEEGIEVKVNEFFDDNSSSAKLWTTERKLKTHVSACRKSSRCAGIWSSKGYGSPT